VNSLPKTVTRQRRGWFLNPGPSAPESSRLTTRLPSVPCIDLRNCCVKLPVTSHSPVVRVTGFGSFYNSTYKRVLDLLKPGDLRLGRL